MQGEETSRDRVISHYAENRDAAEFRTHARAQTHTLERRTFLLQGVFFLLDTLERTIPRSSVGPHARAHDPVLERTLVQRGLNLKGEFNRDTLERTILRSSVG